METGKSERVKKTMRARLLEGLGANVAIGISYRVQSGFEAQLKIQGISRIQSIRIIVYRLSEETTLIC